MVKQRWPIKTCRRPNFDVPLSQGSPRIVKIRRHDADDAVQVCVHSDALAENVWVTSECSLPEPVADDDFLCISRRMICRRKRAAQLGFYCDIREMIGRHDQETDTRRLT